MINKHDFENMNYTNFRNFMDELTYKKKQFKDLDDKRKELYSNYQKIYKEYLDVKKKADKKREDILNLVPEKWGLPL